MGKDKIRRFAENEMFECLIQPEFDEVYLKDYKLKGRWRELFFKNDNPIVLELGCGRGEYTVGLAKANSDKNFIGIDIKGARLWRGARTVTEENIPNGGFLRTRIEFIPSFFAENEIDEIWITFPDPQLKKNRVKKRLTAAPFLDMYSKFLKEDGKVNLKTDSHHLYHYTREVIKENGLEEFCADMDIYNAPKGVVPEAVTSLQTTYEAKYLAEDMPITYLNFGLKKNFEYISPEYAPDNEL